MASAPAPAVPSSAAPAPAAPSTPGNAQPASAPAEQTSTPARAPLRPIPPPPPLPGVLPDADPAAPSHDFADAPPVGARPRGPDGRFLPGESATTPDAAAPDAGEHTQPQELEPATEDTPPSTKFKFAGKEYETQQQAEQAFRTLQGHFKPVMNLARSLGGVDKISPTLERAAASARGWQAEANRLAAELEQARNGAPQPASAAQTDTAPADAPATGSDVDWELYAEIRRLADAKGEPWKAEQWLMQQIRDAERTRYERMLDERLAPFNNAQAHAATVEQTENLWTQLSTYTNDDGSPAFPELHDESAAYEIGRMWANLQLPPEYALSPQGALAAVAMYRMRRPAASAATSSDTARPAPPRPSAATPPLPATPSDAAAAAGIGDGRTRPVSAGTADGPSAEAARILAGLRSVNNGNRNLLGFDA